MSNRNEFWANRLQSSQDKKLYENVWCRSAIMFMVCFIVLYIMRPPIVTDNEDDQLSNNLSLWRLSFWGVFCSISYVVLEKYFLNTLNKNEVGVQQAEQSRQIRQDF